MMLRFLIFTTLFTLSILATPQALTPQSQALRDTSSFLAQISIAIVKGNTEKINELCQGDRKVLCAHVANDDGVTGAVLDSETGRAPQTDSKLNYDFLQVAEVIDKLKKTKPSRFTFLHHKDKKVAEKLVKQYNKLAQKIDKDSNGEVVLPSVHKLLETVPDYEKEQAAEVLDVDLDQLRIVNQCATGESKQEIKEDVLENEQEELDETVQGVANDWAKEEADRIEASTYPEPGVEGRHSVNLHKRSLISDAVNFIENVFKAIFDAVVALGGLIAGLLFSVVWAAAYIVGSMIQFGAWLVGCAVGCAYCCAGSALRCVDCMTCGVSCCCCACGWSGKFTHGLLSAPFRFASVGHRVAWDMGIGTSVGVLNWLAVKSFQQAGLYRDREVDIFEHRDRVHERLQGRVDQID